MLPPSLIDRVIFPFHERLKGKPTYARLRELEESQWLTPEALRELQFARLQRHLQFAYREVPYYQRLLDEHGLPPSRIASFEDFAKIPCLTKELIRKHLDDLQPRTRLRRVQRLSTGGSTGTPVTVLVDSERSAFTDAARLRTHRWYGVGMGARESVLWGSPIELTRQDRLRKLRDRLLNSRLLSAFDLGPPALARYAAAIGRDRPQKLYGYASALYLLARYLGQNGWPAEPGWPRAIFTTAEPLYDFQRQTIESVFGCAVSVEYGCRDGGLIAMECPWGKLHIPAEGMVVEVLGGEIVVTNLYSFAMPIIRYRTGDVGTLGDAGCHCGRGLPALSSIEGRRTDFIVTSTGKVMHALALIYVLREAQGVREFQVVQENLHRLRVSIVPDESFSDAAHDAIGTGLARLFDGDMSVDITLQDAIARPASGKHRYVVSNVADRYLDGLLASRS